MTQNIGDQTSQVSAQRLVRLLTLVLIAITFIGFGLARFSLSIDYDQALGTATESYVSYPSIVYSALLSPYILLILAMGLLFLQKKAALWVYLCFAIIAVEKLETFLRLGQFGHLIIGSTILFLPLGLMIYLQRTSEI